MALISIIYYPSFDIRDSFLRSFKIVRIQNHLILGTSVSRSCHKTAKISLVFDRFSDAFIGCFVNDIVQNSCSSMIYISRFVNDAFLNWFERSDGRIFCSNSCIIEIYINNYLFHLIVRYIT